MAISLAGKAVVVTGSGRGLGRAYARAAAAAGAKLVVNDVLADNAHSVAKEITDAGGQAVASGHAVDDPDQAEAMVALCCDTFGGIDGLINNAGLFTFGPADAVDLRRARSLFDVNIFGVLHSGLAAIRRMSKTRRGTIVNVTSGASLGMPELNIYGASKGAVNAITANWAIEWAERATILGLSPIADTAMARMQYGDQVRSNPPEDVAPLAVFLLSEEARRLHGRTVRLSMGKLGLLQPARFEMLPAEGPWDADRISAAIPA
jgi:NAD(P)-dependent dehydrogenase (short-subunit alcohol dehydrogenase family)